MGELAIGNKQAQILPLCDSVKILSDKMVGLIAFLHKTN